MIEKNAKLDLVHKMKQRTSYVHKSKVQVDTTGDNKSKATKGKKKSLSDSQMNMSKEIEMMDQKAAKYDTSIDAAEGQEEGEDPCDNLMGIELDEDDSKADEEAEEDLDNKPISAETLEENSKKRFLTMVIRILKFL